MKFGHTPNIKSQLVCIATEKYKKKFVFLLHPHNFVDKIGHRHSVPFFCVNRLPGSVHWNLKNNNAKDTHSDTLLNSRIPKNSPPP